MDLVSSVSRAVAEAVLRYLEVVTCVTQLFLGQPMLYPRIWMSFVGIAIVLRPYGAGRGGVVTDLVSPC